MAGEAMPCGASGAPVPALIATGPRRSAPSPRDERGALVPASIYVKPLSLLFEHFNFGGGGGVVDTARVVIWPCYNNK